MNSKLKYAVSALCLAGTSLSISQASALEGDWGKLYGDFRLRYETVDQDNALKDADALTLRSKIGYSSPSVNGLSATLEIENSESLVDDFSVPPSKVKPGEFSVIADPDHTEIDQAFIAYKGDGIQGKLGRQVITLDNHRFVGHVGWRQDRQTFDALSISVAPSEGVNVSASYIDKRNRIFSDDADIDSKDLLLNASFATGIGKLSTYAYLLEVDNGSDNALDTFGVRLAGKKGVFGYTAELASQSAETSSTDFDATYALLEGSYKLDAVTLKAGYEILGSDDGAYAFSTPLATLHKFNGWADQFLGTPSAGLEDLYISLVTKIMGGKFVITYHDFSSDESVAGADDLGNEIDVLYAKKLSKTFSGGVKYASYSAGDASFGKVDTDKLWVWLGTKF